MSSNEVCTNCYEHMYSGVPYYLDNKIMCFSCFFKVSSNTIVIPSCCLVNTWTIAKKVVAGEKQFSVIKGLSVPQFILVIEELKKISFELTTIFISVTDKPAIVN